MIIEYHRPETLEQALELLARTEPRTIPLGGGTKLQATSSLPVAVVDLQALAVQPDLELGLVRQVGSSLRIGAMVTLQYLLESADIPVALETALLTETSINLRNVATVAGTLLSASGRSPFATVMLALDAAVEVVGLPGSRQSISLGDILALRDKILGNQLVLGILIPINTHLAYEYIARTPADFPIVAAAVAQWPSGRTRVSLAGYGASPMLATDGPEPGGVEIAAREAYRDAGDEWASAEYRSAMAEVLTRRCLNQIYEVKNG